MHRNMLRDIGADYSLPALDMENFPAPQPIADADHHSSDEIMEPREDVAEHVLPLDDDVVQPVQGSRSSTSSSSSSSTCSDNLEEFAGCPFSVPRNIGGCKWRYDDREALWCIGVTFYTARTISEQYPRDLVLPCCARSFGRVCAHQTRAPNGRAQESYLGLEPASEQLHVEHRPQLKRKTNSVNTPTTPHQF